MSITNTSETKLIEIRLKLLLLRQQQLIKEFAVVLIAWLIIIATLFVIGILTAFLSVLITIVSIATAAVIGKTITMLAMTLVMLKLFVIKGKTARVEKSNQINIDIANFQTKTITLLILLIGAIALMFRASDITFWGLLLHIGTTSLIMAWAVMGISIKFAETKTSSSEKEQILDILDSESSKHNSYFANLIQNCLCRIAPKTWNKTCDSFLDTVEAFPNEKNRWEQRNLKFVAYLVVACDLFGFFRYFTKTLISNAIAIKRVLS